MLSLYFVSQLREITSKFLPRLKPLMHLFFILPPAASCCPYLALQSHSDFPLSAPGLHIPYLQPRAPYLCLSCTSSQSSLQDIPSFSFKLPHCIVHGLQALLQKCSALGNTSLGRYELKWLKSCNVINKKINEKSVTSADHP